MKREFKVNDVVQYWVGSKPSPRDMAEAIVDYIDEDGLWLFAWRGNPRDQKWVVSKGLLNDFDTVRPHPRPDAVWAEFAKWQLAGGADAD